MILSPVKSTESGYKNKTNIDDDVINLKAWLLNFNDVTLQFILKLGYVHFNF